MDNKNPTPKPTSELPQLDDVNAAKLNALYSNMALPTSTSSSNSTQNSKIDDANCNIR
ncbi:hypothetical protein I4U23_028100 [Adineta vaga]|nr:hypothetical protein I4U23_028100 [Adineta vaga]